MNGAIFYIRMRLRKEKCYHTGAYGGGVRPLRKLKGRPVLLPKGPKSTKQQRKQHGGNCRREASLSDFAQG